MDVPPHYPDQLTDAVLLDDGTAVSFRAILPSDSPVLERLFHRLSSESLYRRFLTPVPRPRQAMVQRLVHVDYVDRLAVVAEVAGEIVGVARYDRLAPVSEGQRDEAEASVIVEDAWQGRGIATHLLRRLSAAARERGIRAFVATVLGENRPILGLLRALADDVEVALHDGVYTVRLQLDSVPRQA